MEAAPPAGVTAALGHPAEHTEPCQRDDHCHGSGHSYPTLEDSQGRQLDRVLFKVRGLPGG